MSRPAVRRAWRWGRRLPPLVWFTLVWLMLWGNWTVANAINGLLVGIVVTLVLPLPRVQLGSRVHPLGVARIVVRIGVDLVLSSLRVARQALSPGPQPGTAVVATRLRTRSDLILTLTAEAVTMVPGSVVIEVSRPEGILYAHVLGIDDPSDVVAFRRHVLDLEASVIRAIGSPRAVRALQTERAAERKGGGAP